MPDTALPDTTPTTEPSPDGATAQHGLTEHSHGAGADTPSQGGSALDRFASADPAEHPVPGGREEAWRFTPMRRLRSLHADAPLTGTAPTVEIDADDAVQVTTTSRTESTTHGTSGYLPVDRPSARAWAEATSVVSVTVPTEVRAERPTVVRVHGADVQNASAGHVVITAEAFSQAVVVLEYTGSQSLVDNVEVVARDGAHLTVVTLHDWDDDAVHLSHHHVLVGRDAQVKHVVVSFGGDLVRTATTSTYDGTGGRADLLGLYYVDADQHIENRLLVDHNTPRASSNVEYKGALQGKNAHAVWVGDVLIRPSAEGIDTYELNRNLLLTEGARADSIPNLEIETGEIEGAGHASATGRFDDEQLFYLQARGIPPEQARRLVVRGFFASLINQIGVPELTERLMTRVEKELAVAESLEESAPATQTTPNHS